MANIANFITISGLETLENGTTNPGGQAVMYREPIPQPLWIVTTPEEIIEGEGVGVRPDDGQVWPRGNS
jgi:hypothetical protein